MRKIVLNLVLLVFLLPALDAFAGDSQSSAQNTNYLACAACHGQEGKGNLSLKAPGLANLESDYIRRQLLNFRDGVRGAHPQDTNGSQMRAFVANLGDSGIDDLADYAAAMEDYEPVSTLPGNPEQGKNFYYHQCGACHGVAAKGNASLNAPKLAGLEDWYLSAQLHNFRDGIRGAHEQDKLGAQMHFMMQRLPNSEQITDIIAYLRKPVDAE